MHPEPFIVGRSTSLPDVSQISSEVALQVRSDAQMVFQEYNAVKKDSIQRPFINILPNDGIYKFLEENYTPVFEFPFSKYAAMYFARDRRVRQSESELSNFSPTAPQYPLLIVDEQYEQACIEVESLIMMYMCDLPIQGNPTSLLDCLVQHIKQSDEVLENCYCFLMKQTTANMKQVSEERGWGLFNYILSVKLPPRNLYTYVLYFICKSLFSSEVQVESSLFVHT